MTVDIDKARRNCKPAAIDRFALGGLWNTIDGRNLSIPDQDICMPRLITQTTEHMAIGQDNSLLIRSQYRAVYNPAYVSSRIKQSRPTFWTPFTPESIQFTAKTLGSSTRDRTNGSIVIGTGGSSTPDIISSLLSVERRVAIELLRVQFDAEPRLVRRIHLPSANREQTASNDIVREVLIKGLMIQRRVRGRDTEMDCFHLVQSKFSQRMEHDWKPAASAMPQILRAPQMPSEV